MKVPVLCVLLLVVAITAPANGDDRVRIAVSPLRSFAPSLVRIRVRVEPNAENRMLQVIADGDNFYRQSDIQLEGDKSPATVQLELRNLPDGEYEFKGVLIDSTGNQRAMARAQATVMAPGGPPPPPPQ